MATSHSRGHEVYYDWETRVWRYVDTKEIENKTRPCKRCGCTPTREGYDACLGYIAGATSACCGHGIEEPYVVKNE